MFSYHSGSCQSTKLRESTPGSLCPHSAREQPPVIRQGMLSDIPPIVLLPIAFVLPVLMIFVSFRLNFNLHASILLIVFLLGSVFAGSTGLINIYRHVSNMLDLSKVLVIISYLFLLCNYLVGAGFAQLPLPVTDLHQDSTEHGLLCHLHCEVLDSSSSFERDSE